MSKRARIVEKQLKDKTVFRAFNQMIGAESADPAIISPKHTRLHAQLRKFATVARSMAGDVLPKLLPEQSGAFDDMKTFAARIDVLLARTAPGPSAAIAAPEAKEEAEAAAAAIVKEYAELKTNNDVKIIVLTCRNLVRFKIPIETAAADGAAESEGDFVLRIPGAGFTPFEFAAFDVKAAWASDTINAEAKRYIMLCLRTLMDTSRAIYEIITSPDVDVREFSRSLITCIEKLKRTTPGCDDAFKKIADSVGLLERNFSGYYKDFVQSENPGTIIESFVMDVSREGNTKLKTIQQFKKIIAQYRRQSRGQSNPMLQKIFGMIKTNFDLMDEAAGEDAAPAAAAEPQVAKKTSSAKRRERTKRQAAAAREAATMMEAMAIAEDAAPEAEEKKTSGGGGGGGEGEDEYDGPA